MEYKGMSWAADQSCPQESHCMRCDPATEIYSQVSFHLLGREKVFHAEQENICLNHGSFVNKFWILWEDIYQLNAIKMQNDL